MEEEVINKEETNPNETGELDQEGSEVKMDRDERSMSESSDTTMESAESNDTAPLKQGEGGDNT